MTSVLRCAQCGFDAAPEHFKGDLCSICAEPVKVDMLEQERSRPFGPIVKCRCGCGATFHQFDKKGRIRWYANAGHYNRVCRVRKGAS